MQNKLLLTLDQVCETLQIGRSKAFALINAGILPSLKIGRLRRVPLDTLRAWIQQQVTAGEGYSEIGYGQDRNKHE
jgi:excisionase family DNA binding protein